MDTAWKIVSNEYKYDLFIGPTVLEVAPNILRKCSQAFLY